MSVLKNKWDGNQFIFPGARYVPSAQPTLLNPVPISNIPKGAVLKVPERNNEGEGGSNSTSVHGPSNVSNPVNAAISSLSNTVANAVGKNTNPIGYSPGITDTGMFGAIGDVGKAVTGNTSQFGFGGKYGPVGFNPNANYGVSPGIDMSMFSGPQISFSGPLGSGGGWGPVSAVEAMAMADMAQPNAMGGKAAQQAPAATNNIGGPAGTTQTAGGIETVGDNAGHDSQSNCYISTALNDAGVWSDSEKRIAVKWCRETHHQNGEDMWVRGYHIWGLAVSKLARKNKSFRVLTRYLSNKFVDQATGRKKTVLGWCVKNLFADPLSYVIGALKKRGRNV